MFYKSSQEHSLEQVRSAIVSYCWYIYYIISWHVILEKAGNKNVGRGVKSVTPNQPCRYVTAIIQIISSHHTWLSGCR